MSPNESKINRSICVFCSSSSVLASEYQQTAKILGQLMVDNNYDLIYGGTSVGLMGTLAKKMVEVGGMVTGVIPEIIMKKGIEKKDIGELIIARDLAERKQIMIDKAQGFIALPGGFGTLEELMEVIVLKQLGEHKKPISIINTNGHYNHLVNLFEQLYQDKFAKESYRDLYFFASTPETAIEYINSYKATDFTQKWF
ncbi:MAG: LOG family protein [Candidatus Kariarchaeaceae archaeon]|jgi:uncharacterized protein (TIGR00730 family)